MYRSLYFPAALLGTASLLSLPGFAAGPPTAFDAWSQNGGNVSTSGCPSGFNCSETVNDKGMVQRTLIDSSGKRYYQTIVYDSQAGTSLSSESFVMGNNLGDGISSKQVLSVSGTTSINSTSVINTGWASKAGAGSDIRIDQSMSDNSISNVGYIDNFAFESTQDANENVTGYYLDIRQEVTNSAGNVSPPSGSQIEGSLSGRASGQDKHVFVTRKAAGSFVTSSGSGSLSSSGMGGMMGGGGPQGGTVSWRVGDEVQVIWIGQVCDGCQTTGGMMGGGGMGGGGSDFSYQSYDNLSDGSSGVAGRSISQTAPLDWQTDPFGSQPQF